VVVEVTRNDVVAFRVRAHHLSHGSRARDLVDAAGACGVQNSPPGSGLLALHARAPDVTQAQFDVALTQDKTLLQTWCMRGAPYIFPTALAPVFTAGVLPPTEDGLRHFLPGVVPVVDELGLSLTQIVELVRDEIRDVLTGRRLAITEIGVKVAERIAVRLSTKQRVIWLREGPYASGQAVGAGVVHFAVRVLALQGVVCFAAREGRKAPFVLMDEWLGAALPSLDPKPARADLLRCYLRRYGPSTRADFAAWLGVRAADVDPWWTEVEDELVDVQWGRTGWLLAEDLQALQSAPPPRGAWLLPPHDPYTQARDRQTIVEQTHLRDVYRGVGAPGAVLLDAEIVATWRARKTARLLSIDIRPFHRLSAGDRKRIEAAAARVGVLRGAAMVEVRIV